MMLKGSVVLLVIISVLFLACGSGSESEPNTVDTVSEFPVDLGNGQLLIADNELGVVIIQDVQEVRGLTEDERELFNDLRKCLNIQYGIPDCNPPEPIIYVADIVQCGNSTSAVGCTAQFGESIALEPQTGEAVFIHEIVHVIQWSCAEEISLNHCEDYWNNFCGDILIQLKAPRICPANN